MGKNGPTTLIMKGKRRKAAYTDSLLVEHGCEPGLTISMTESAYMTYKSWVGITNLIVNGYHKITFIR